MGPLETLVKKVYDLENIVYDLQRNKEYDRDYYKGLYGNQTWVSGNPIIQTLVLLVVKLGKIQ
jgi:hypothetical protein